MKNLLLIPVFLLPTLANAQQKPTKNIVETAIAAGKFKTLAAALGKAGLVKALSGKGPFTVFAPTDEAFAKLPKGTVAALLKPENKAKLTAILTYHVVAGKVDALTALKVREAKTLQGAKIKVSLAGGQLRVNKSKVIQNDVQTTNGIIHIIDTVLLPPAPKQLSKAQALRKVIEDAIDVGVPLYNDGKQAECAAIYRIAAFSVLNFGRKDLRRATVRSLEKALATVSMSKNSDDNAWTLRAALDITLRDLMHSSRRSKSAASNTNRNQTKMLFNFDKRDAWRTVNDNVMGGVSKGQIVVDGRGTARFAGQLSLRNNGGFSSARSKAKSLGLAGYDGLVLRVKGDGRTYNLGALTSDNRWQTRTYQASFKTKKGEWQEIRVPFSAMQQRRFGRQVRSNPISGDKVRSLSFSISDKKETPFSLEIDWIKGYRGDAAASSAL